MKKLSIDFFKKLAEKKGGKCLSDTYVNNTKKLTFQCKEGHIWSATPKHIKNRNQWCKVCYGSSPLSIEEMQKLAHKHGGKCLSDTYVNNRTKLTWQCKKGHTWEATPSHIKSRTNGVKFAMVHHLYRSKKCKN